MSLQTSNRQAFGPTHPKLTQNVDVDSSACFRVCLALADDGGDLKAFGLRALEFRGFGAYEPRE